MKTNWENYSFNLDGKKYCINKINNKLIVSEGKLAHRKEPLIKGGYGNLIVDDWINGTGSGSPANGQTYPSMMCGSSVRVRTPNLIKIHPDTNYCVTMSENLFDVAFIEFDKDLVQLKDSSWKSFSSKYIYKTLPNSEYILLIIKYNTSINSDPISPSEVAGKITFSRASINNMPILTDRPILRGIPGGAKDTIEKHSDGKYYYHKRCEEIILNGTEPGWRLFENNDTYGKFETYDYRDMLISGLSMETIPKILCDKLPIVSDRVNNHKVSDNITQTVPRSISISLNKSHLSEFTLVGFKSWIKTNNITVIVELVNEEIYELNNLDLETYDNTTIICTNQRVITPKISLALSSYVGKYMKIIQDRIKSLEQDFINSNITQNILQLNNTYSTDRLSYNIDISLCNNTYSDTVDENLFKLILDVILSGKENYKYSKIENIIDFYTVLGKLDFEMAEILFNTLDECV